MHTYAGNNLIEFVLYVHLIYANGYKEIPCMVYN